MSEEVNTIQPIKFSPELTTKEQLPEDAVYLFDKPKGISSFAAVYQVRTKLKEVHGKKVKVGHCGTLDPIATGLLILVSGKMTKRAGEFSKMDKVYTAEAKLGASSTTYDSEGELSLISQKEPSPKKLKVELNKLIGEIQQTPPAFSAIKINGQRAYKLARAGETVKLKPRPVTVYKLELLDYSYPTLKLNVHVSSGTYIRSLIHDLGVNLRTGAHMTELRRTHIGPYSL